MCALEVMLPDAKKCQIDCAVILKTIYVDGWSCLGSSE